MINIEQLKLYRYSESELKRLLKSIVIICDTREKTNEHITGYFENKGIQYMHQALNFGDYSYILPACPELGVNRDMYFNNSIVIERKADLNEFRATWHSIGSGSRMSF